MYFYEYLCNILLKIQIMNVVLQVVGYRFIPHMVLISLFMTVLVFSDTVFPSSKKEVTITGQLDIFI